MLLSQLPPCNYLEAVFDNSLFVFPYHYLEIEEYLNFYHVQKELQKYLIIDLSEYGVITNQNSPNFIFELNPDEVILPVSKNDFRGNFELQTSFISWFSNFGTKDFNLMIVPSGESIYLWKNNLDLLTAAYNQSGLDKNSLTIGIDKVYQDWFGGVPNLISRYCYKYQNPIHIYGWINYPEQIELIRNFGEKVRSISIDLDIPIDYLMDIDEEIEYFEFIQECKIKVGDYGA